MTPGQIEELCKVTVTVAVAEIGRGEQGGNNLGPDIDKYGAPSMGSWCAAFLSWCYSESARMLNVTMPFKLSVTAKGLGRNIANVGRKFADPRKARPGDVVVWHRGIAPWQGHIGLVISNFDGATSTIEGNVGPYPARVKPLIHDVTRERLAFFASLRKG